MTYIIHNSIHIIYCIGIVANVRLLYVHICCNKHICWLICLLHWKCILMSWLEIIEQMKKYTTTTFMFIYMHVFLLFDIVIAIYVCEYIYMPLYNNSFELFKVVVWDTLHNFYFILYDTAMKYTCIQLCLFIARSSIILPKNHNPIMSCVILQFYCWRS